MKLAPVFAALMAVPFALAQQGETVGFDALIKRLGSADFRQREAAMEALKKDPKSASSVREALRSPNAEIAQRAATVLEYHDRRPVRELAAAAKDGRIEAVVEILAEWPTGKYEPEAWNPVRELIRTIADLHEKQSGKKIDVPWLRDGAPVVVVSGPNVKDLGEHEMAYFFVRARSVELSPLPGKTWTNTKPGGVLAASRSVKFRACGDTEHTIFAGGSVEVGGLVCSDIIVSGGDVTISSGSLSGSLVIARGKVICTRVLMGGCRIISGKSVVYDKKLPGKCVITENEPNPLGFIRWSDAPKGEKEKGKVSGVDDTK